jgi:hypothetical protein
MLRVSMATIVVGFLLLVSRVQSGDDEASRLQRELAEQRSENQRLQGVILARRFVLRGYLTRDELKRAPFGSPATIAAPLKGDKNFRVDKFEAATYVAELEFRPGEPIPVCFVLRSMDDKQRRFPPAFDFCTGVVAGNGPRVLVTNLNSKKEHPIRVGLQEAVIPNGLMDSEGCYFASANLNDVLQNPLPEGDYEVCWSYSTLCSSAARFRVLPDPQGGLRPIEQIRPIRAMWFPRRQFLLAQVSRASDLAAAAKIDDPPGLIRWVDAAIQVRHWNAIAPKLSAGMGGKHYGDLRLIPNRDDMLEVSAAWETNKGETVLRVTMNPRSKSFDVWIPVEPYILLCQERDLDDSRAAKEDREDIDRPKPERERRNHRGIAPRTFEIPLPKDWHKAFAADPKARISVIISAEPFEFPDPNRLVRAEVTPVGQVHWKGVLRTAPSDVPMPPRAKE